MPVIDLKKVPALKGSSYPAPHDVPCAERLVYKLGAASGLTQFGANVVELPPGAQSSMRHWHTSQDEFFMILEGTLTLVDDHGPQELRPFECASFPKNDGNGHHFINSSAEPARFLVIGTHSDQDTVYYSDINMMARCKGTAIQFETKDGTPLSAPK